MVMFFVTMYKQREDDEKMKHKKLFAILTLVCFMFTLMPVAAMAEGENVAGTASLYIGTSTEVTTTGTLAFVLGAAEEWCIIYGVTADKAEEKSIYDTSQVRENLGFDSINHSYTSVILYC